MGRVLSIWLPDLPLDRRRRLEDPRLEGPFAITQELKNAHRVTHFNEAASHAGVTAGLTLADARAICPQLLTEPCDTAREEMMLRGLCRWADAFSPKVSLDPPDGLLLDITGCAHLFGGEMQMGGLIRERLSDLLIASHVGVADTKVAARALARHSSYPVAIAPSGSTAASLKDYPLEGLDADERVVNDLRRLGLKTIGDIYNYKSSELARRFGLGLPQKLEAALGYAVDPICPDAVAPIYAARMTLPDPIGFHEDVLNVLDRLAQSVCARLEAAKKGARRFLFTVRCVDTGDQILSVGFAKPCNTPALIRQQFSHPIDKLKIEYGADWFRLLAERVEPLVERQTTIDSKARSDDALVSLISTLGNRLGFNRVRCFIPNDSHTPEREYETVEAVSTPPSQQWRMSPRLRPARLFPQPEILNIVTAGRPPLRFEWRRRTYDTAQTLGPERITPEWWLLADRRTRDYWHVQTQQGERLWLLTYPQSDNGEWFVAGKFL